MAALFAEVGRYTLRSLDQSNVCTKQQPADSSGSECRWRQRGVV